MEDLDEKLAKYQSKYTYVSANFVTYMHNMMEFLLSVSTEITYDIKPSDILVYLRLCECCIIRFMQWILSKLMNSPSYHTAGIICKAQFFQAIII